MNQATRPRLPRNRFNPAALFLAPFRFWIFFPTPIARETLLEPRPDGMRVLYIEFCAH